MADNEQFVSSRLAVEHLPNGFWRLHDIENKQEITLDFEEVEALLSLLSQEEEPPERAKQAWTVNDTSKGTSNK